MKSFLAEHWVVGGITTSLLWFVLGRYFSSDRNRDFAIVEQWIGIMMILALCGWTLFESEWIGLVASVSVLTGEIWMTLRKERGIAASEFAVREGGFQSAWSFSSACGFARLRPCVGSKPALQGT